MTELFGQLILVGFALLLLITSGPGLIGHTNPMCLPGIVSIGDRACQVQIIVPVHHSPFSWFFVA
jgi:hypothetical protein